MLEFYQIRYFNRISVCSRPTTLKTLKQTSLKTYILGHEFRNDIGNGNNKYKVPVVAGKLLVCKNSLCSVHAHAQEK